MFILNLIAPIIPPGRKVLKLLSVRQQMRPKQRCAIIRAMNLAARLTGIFLFILLVSGCASPTPTPTIAPTPIDITPRLTEAAYLAEERQYSAALGVLQEAARLDTSNAQPLTAMGDIYLQQHRWAPAREAFDDALAIQTDSYDAAAGLAEALLRQGERSQSSDAWRKAIEMDGFRYEGWLGLGRISLAMRSYEEAEQAFAEALAHEPEAPQALWYLAALTTPTDAAAGEAYLKRIAIPAGDYLLATLESLPPSAPQSEVAALTGIALTQLGEWELAHHALSTATELDPANATAWAFLGYVQASLRLPALDSLDQAEELDPTSVLALYFKGIYLRQKGHYDLAVDHFLKALDLDPGNVGVAIETALTLAEKGDYLSAEAWYRAIVESEADSAEYQQLLTEFYVNRSYRIVENGLVEAKRLVELAPDDAHAHDLLGWAKFQSGDFSGAEESLRLAVTLDPKDIAARYHLGKTLEALHKNVDAQAEFTRVVDWDTSGVYRARILGAAAK